MTITTGRDHVAALANTLALFGQSARWAISQSDEFDDADTADVFTQVSPGIDKWLWLGEAHLHQTRRNAE